MWKWWRINSRIEGNHLVFGNRRHGEDSTASDSAWSRLDERSMLFDEEIANLMKYRAARHFHGMVEEYIL